MEACMAVWQATRLELTKWPPLLLISVSAIRRTQTSVHTDIQVWQDTFAYVYSPTILASLESPVVTVALSEILIGIGETTVMACSASGVPQPEIRWYKGNNSKAEVKQS